ncbi:MAG: hypothetical protein HIU84_13570 [Acidobacteria bacterium]|nr:hypothetical protein [Acidobacteriota bacterium]
MVFCLTFDDAVGMDDSPVRQTAGIRRSDSVVFNIAAASNPPSALLRHLNKGRVRRRWRGEVLEV